MLLINWIFYKSIDEILLEGTFSQLWILSFACISQYITYYRNIILNISFAIPVGSCYTGDWGFWIQDIIILFNTLFKNWNKNAIFFLIISLLKWSNASKTVTLQSE
jgi:hypothetical protein